jgi:uridine kinase
MPRQRVRPLLASKSPILTPSRPQGIVQQWMRFVKPNFELYVDPQKKNADIMVPRGIENTTAIQMIVKHISRALQRKSAVHLEQLRSLGQEPDDTPLSNNVKILPQTPQLMGMHTIIHNNLTRREEFLFYFDRMATLLVEKALDHLDYAPTEITTKQEMRYVGCKLAGSGEVGFCLAPLKRMGC